MSATPETPFQREAFRRALGEYPTAPPQADEEWDLVAFVARNGGRYLARLRSIRQGSWSFNAAAFLFAPFWLAYRKLYEWAAAWLVLSIGIDFGFRALASAATTDDFGLVSWLVALLMAMGAGLLGYPLLFARLTQLRRQADQRHLTGEARWAFLQQRGDVSFAGLAAVIALLGIYYYWRLHYAQ